VIATEFGDTTPFGIHFDDAPTVYINGNPGQTDPVTRKLEREVGQLLGFDVLDGSNGGTDHVTKALADYAEQDLLHMITADPNRTPNFILFANPDYFFTTSGTTPPPLCTPQQNAATCFVEESGFAWNHGDFQNQITHTWLGMVGPGVRSNGRFGEIFSDHTDTRPTILSLVGLKDDYAHDGRVIFEILHKHALPDAVRDQEETLHRLAVAYKNINAPVGPLGLASLQIATAGITSTDARYARVTESLRDLTEERDEIAGAMIQMLEDAAFRNKKVNEERAERLIDAAEDLLRHTR